MGSRLVFYKEDLERLNKLLSSVVALAKLNGATMVWKDESVILSTGSTEVPGRRFPLRHDITLVVAGSPAGRMDRRVAPLNEYLDMIVERKGEGEKVSEEFGRWWRGPSAPA